MILRRVTQHIKEQNWFAVAIDFLIVVVGVFIGIQVANWNQASQNLHKEQVYIQRLSQELNVTIERLEGGYDAYLGSVNAIQTLINARKEYQLKPAIYQANESQLIESFDAMGRGRVPASSPAVFDEMVANGELQLIRNTKLRQALYEFDEFSNVSFHAWNTLRHHYINAIGPITGILIYKTTQDINVIDSLTNIVVPDGLDLQRFLTQPNVLGALSSIMEAQANQLAIVVRQLELARDIKAQIESQDIH